jgi:hypothetical protein
VAKSPARGPATGGESTAMTQPEVGYERHDSIVVITINRPARGNSLGRGVREGT